MEEKKLSFEDRIDFIQFQIGKRKNGWTLSTLEWEDVSQIILTRVWQKYHTFNPEKGKFEHWLNRLISHALVNLLRDNLYKYVRPCISSGPSGGSCVKNTGGDGCSWTKSKTQCAECPLYAKWQKKKETKYNIKATVSIENHDQETNNIISDSIDIAESKKVIDEQMKVRLNHFEWSIYEMLYIENYTEDEVGKKLKYKKSKNSKTHGYQVIRGLKNKFISITKEIIEEHALIP